MAKRIVYFRPRLDDPTMATYMGNTASYSIRAALGTVANSGATAQGSHMRTLRTPTRIPKALSESSQGLFARPGSLNGPVQRRYLHAEEQCLSVHFLPWVE